MEETGSELGLMLALDGKEKITVEVRFEQGCPCLVSFEV